MGEDRYGQRFFKIIDRNTRQLFQTNFRDSFQSFLLVLQSIPFFLHTLKENCHFLKKVFASILLRHVPSLKGKISKYQNLFLTMIKIICKISNLNHRFQKY